MGIDIWNKKYRDGNETFDEWLERVSNGDKNVTELIKNKKFLFGGRILANRGLANKGLKMTYSNCYVITPPEDNIESIFDCAKKLARTYSYGGGCGIDISKLSPNGAKINNAAKQTSGSTSFMDLYSLVTGLICQHGRRGALMISLSCEHPDLEEFIGIKSDLTKVTKANISIRITDKFMAAVKNKTPFTLSFTRVETGEIITKTVDAHSFFRKICEMNWDYAEPGMLFWNRIENWNLLSCDNNFHYAGVNPCFSGNMKLLTKDGYKTFEELCNTEPEIINYYGNIVKSKVWCSGEKETVKVITSDNNEIVCTPNHKFLVIRKNGNIECEADELKGRRIASWNNGNPTTVKVKDVVPYKKCKVYDFTEPELHWGIVEGYVVHNCAEEPLPAGGSCLLGSINLAKFVTPDKLFDFDDFRKTVNIAVKALNDVLEEGLPLHPLQEQRDSVRDWRQIGLGIFGLADMLIEMELDYGGSKSIDLCNLIGMTMADEALATSSQIAKEKGTYPKYSKDAVTQSAFFSTNALDDTIKMINEHGLRNSQLLTIAPTGSLSTMLGVSGGIEPIFANYYTRKTESLHGHDEYYKVYTPIVQKYMDDHNLKDDSELPHWFVTAQTLNYKKRVDMQGIWQKHIDASISSTVNVPNDFTVDEVEDLYMYAWEKGLKGVTLFRDGCKRGGILTTEKPKDNKDNNTTDTISETPEVNSDNQLKRGMIVKADDNCIGRKRTLRTGCGTLHCEAFFDPNSGKLLETYFSKGSSGGCNNFMIGLSRMISLAARGGVDIDSIIDQLNSCGTCPSYAVRKATKHDTSKGSCCPVAIGNALKDMHNEILSDIDVDENIMQNIIACKPKRGQTIKTLTEAFDNNLKCPECGEPLVFEGGCNICKACGWTKCE